MKEGPTLNFDYETADRIWKTFDVSKSAKKSGGIELVETDGKVDYAEFCVAMQAMRPPEGVDLKSVWEDIDVERKGRIGFDEFHRELSDIFASFRCWCAIQFETSDKMADALSCVSSKEEFTELVRGLGWREMFEEALFSALDKRRDGNIDPGDCSFIDAEARKLRRKEEAKKKGDLLLEKRAQNRRDEVRFCSKSGSRIL